MKQYMQAFNMAKAREALKVAADAPLAPSSLFTPDGGNAKVAKNFKALGVSTLVHHLSPHKEAGVFNVCPGASPGCIKACLHTAGNPAYLVNKTTARVKRTRMLYHAKPEYLYLMLCEMFHHMRRCYMSDVIPAFRLNGTSDLPWEAYKLCGKSILERATDLCDELGWKYPVFYDYTKVEKRYRNYLANRHDWPFNYHLCWSVSEEPHNRALVPSFLDNGGQVAIVVSKEVKKALFSSNLNPRMDITCDGTTVYDVEYSDGDEHDYLPEHAPVVVLAEKGRAKDDTSGFVVRSSQVETEGLGNALLNL